ncbi:glycosyltransferase family 2 protein [Candidatus Falkowbacteria bacterium]|uniref:Glycosyl transferase family 2 n=1 Tax=Candidatus Falkowbacteria bacterium CG10_big_fil_rev_8_21_14_0_10_37_18 TaxID=1974562 RepID=A0A2H0V803_9BACT|nr:glycosyltransferase family 2 protein [Candidatus Falkowbacteria bacterium]NCQ12721.1 glycosyltransferase family 2 protein [Candidatus Falkowbacteria bacterium]OIO05415.1 MAG: glycosyl transferase family 2 [Candidatus Falkowbacteria bacterium CG1_02_37_21]PIR95236.1 MAG: glycosyl transferase family 2 [Candidatus Falkowbacteria bacterium CG10_big_fil_rev_8_21_14_0_10_37_18]
MYNLQKIIVVLPAYNAVTTLEKTVRDLPSLVDEIILVDDKSSDDTVALARQLGLFVFARDNNGGYGANQKTCYRLALEHGADIIVMIHPDYQYDPKLVKYFAEFIGDNYFDVMLGSRIRSRREALAGGMPLYKYVANRTLTMLENMVSGLNLSEWHTGMRAYRRSVLENIDWNNNADDFVFDSQILFQVAARNYSIGEIPVPVRYFPEASSINFWRSLKYGCQTVWTAGQYLFGRFK